MDIYIAELFCVATNAPSSDLSYLHVCICVHSRESVDLWLVRGYDDYVICTYVCLQPLVIGVTS